MTQSKTDELIALADGLGQCADSLHANLMARIRSGEVEPASARSAFEVEVNLRQSANRLYLEAAERIVPELMESQSELLEAVKEAGERMQTIRNFGRVMEVASDLLALATAVHAGKPKLMLAALKEMRSDLKAWENEQPEGEGDEGVEPAA